MFFFNRRSYIFYKYPSEREQQFVPLEKVSVYRSIKSIPANYKKVVLRRRLINPMFYRLARGDAILICYSKNSKQLQAYGWIQTWEPFKHKFKAISNEGVLLGPFWTAPEYRRKGLYTKLIEHCLYICRNSPTIYIFTDPDNFPSQKGIISAGFQLKGKWQITAFYKYSIFSIES